MSASHVLAPRLAVASDNTNHSDVTALLVAKAAAAGGSSSSSSSSICGGSSHGVFKPNLSVAFDAAAVVKPAAISRSIVADSLEGGEQGGMSAEEAQRCREALIADLEVLQREFERFQQQQPAAMDSQVSVMCLYVWRDPSIFL